jgi:hypothetical protein
MHGRRVVRLRTERTTALCGRCFGNRMRPDPNRFWPYLEALAGDATDIITSLRKYLLVCNEDVSIFCAFVRPGISVCANFGRHFRIICEVAVCGPRLSVGCADSSSISGQYV